MKFFPLLLLVGCAAAPVAPPVDVSPCVDIGVVYCRKGVTCAAWDSEDERVCRQSFAQVCPSLKGISRAEADLCMAAIGDASCEGSIPEECVGVAL